MTAVVQRNKLKVNSIIASVKLKGIFGMKEFCTSFILPLFSVVVNSQRKKIASVGKALAFRNSQKVTEVIPL